MPVREKTISPILVQRDSQPPAAIPPKQEDDGPNWSYLTCPFLQHRCIEQKCMMWLEEQRDCSIVINAKANLNAARTIDRQARPRPPGLR